MVKKSRSSTTRARKNLEYRTGKPKRFIVFSFKNFDANQGQSFKEWEDDELLALAINKLRQISTLSIEEAVSQQIIKIYDTFPHKTDFVHPKHIPEGVKWASLHIQGKECFAGFVEDNVFNIVFLDKDHRFWITEKKNT